MNEHTENPTEAAASSAHAASTPPPGHAASAAEPAEPAALPAAAASGRPPLPDRLAVDPRSPHHVAAVFEQPIGIRFNDKERHDVEEYCVSEGWIKVAAGKTRDRAGNPLLIKLKGRVEAFYR